MFRLFFLLLSLLSTPAFAGECPDCADQHVPGISA
jgi:hypothetical protein